MPVLCLVTHGLLLSRTKKERDLSTELPCVVVAYSVRRHLNAHDVVQHAVEGAEDGQLVDFLRDLFQRLQLLQTQQRRVHSRETIANKCF